MILLFFKKKKKNQIHSKYEKKTKMKCSFFFAFMFYVRFISPPNFLPVTTDRNVLHFEPKVNEKWMSKRRREKNHSHT